MKRKVGAPSSYNPSYCEAVIDYLSKGHSVTAFAGKIGRNRDTVFEWRKQHTEFAEALQIAICKAVVFWEDRLIEAASGEFKGNVTAIIFGLKNRAHDDWRDVQKLEHTGKNGGPIQTEEMSARDRLNDLVSRISEREREDKDRPTTH